MGRTNNMPVVRDILELKHGLEWFLTESMITSVSLEFVIDAFLADDPQAIMLLTWFDMVMEKRQPDYKGFIHLWPALP